MTTPIGSDRVRKIGAVGLAMAVLALVGCGGGSSNDKAVATSSRGGASGETSSSSAATKSTSTTGAATSTTVVTSATTAALGLADATEGQHSAPPTGSGVALLKAARVGRNVGFERIVFEFAGSTVPGYTIQWVDPPIIADGSGETVDVSGDAYLQMVMQPASGVDLASADATVVYQGPDRIATAGQTTLITDLVRTGDFEAVLTWVAGTTREVPFRVLALSSPPRLVVDLETS